MSTIETPKCDKCGGWMTMTYEALSDRLRCMCIRCGRLRWLAPLNKTPPLSLSPEQQPSTGQGLSP